ncbi:MAG: YicC family protein [Desulfuromonadales bacterium GWD2_61_12]|nr:MAG: YicC family protein [Desulfuromonadales bacterium GWC2_61_20]OGR34095.1 MAG: YicC family protein [Desulfuromonadales bacterium GWD2_61_12]HAD04800.1 YicC family protein [Desulfuromonas sp.]HBT82319.1 YicC family protein [Desulfuromonas sp.]
MIKSMTGFGKGMTTLTRATLTVEVKTVNHRFCDVSVKSPRSIALWESEIKKRVGERLKRGKIDIFIAVESSSGGATVPTLNLPLAEAYFRLFDDLRGRLGLAGEVPLSLVTGQRDVLVLQEEPIAETDLWPGLEQALEGALEGVEAMRLAEGEATGRDLAARLAILADLLDGVTLRSALVPQEWQARLRERIARLTQELEFDPARVAQEVALFADRCDISEELARFRSHLDQFRSLMGSGEAVGRQLDFLVQELNRETNTIGSKSNDAELARLVVTIKSELEKIREQVQNIE